MKSRRALPFSCFAVSFKYTLLLSVTSMFSSQMKDTLPTFLLDSLFFLLPLVR